MMKSKLPIPDDGKKSSPEEGAGDEPLEALAAQVNLKMSNQQLTQSKNITKNSSRRSPFTRQPYDQTNNDSYALTNKENDYSTIEGNVL